MKLAMMVMMGVLAEAGALADDTDKKGSRSPAALEILEKADAAVRKVQRVRYRADYKGTKWLTKFVPTVTGTATLGERSQYDLERFLCDVKIKEKGSEDWQEYKAGSDGDMFFLIDSKTKMVHEDIDAAVLGSNGRNIRRVLMREFVAEEPFKDELEASTIELRGKSEVGGVECHKVYINGDDAQEAIWYFATRDFLPRRVDRIHENREGEKGTTELVLTDLIVDPKFATDPFKTNVPAGFTKTDDFAP